MAGQYLASFGIDVDAVMRKVQLGPQEQRTSPVRKTRPISKIIAARLPKTDSKSLYDIAISNGIVTSVEPHEASSSNIRHLPGVLDVNGSLCCPSFCHAHVHLDKCFLLSDEKFSDLEMVKGDFAEAMQLTGKAKQRFEDDDLIRRGRRLVEESVQYGVTHMRAFVEVDEVVNLKCVNAALRLRQEFGDVCELQVCAFAQLALFSGEDHGEARRHFMEEALQKEGIEVIGSTPYVEDDLTKMRSNIRWTIESALSTRKHIDFHLDYNLDVNIEPMVWYVLEELKRQKWSEKAPVGRKITLGHCTRLSLLTTSDWQRLNQEIADLPISFVGLPNSDLFMMGRPDDGAASGERPRGTLQVLDMIQQHGINSAIAINNIGNAFTPHGSCNLLRLANNGVAIYQAGTKQAVELLFECVSTRAKSAIGLQSADRSDIQVGASASLVVLGESANDRGPKDVFEAVILPDTAHVQYSLYRGDLI